MDTTELNILTLLRDGKIDEAITATTPEILEKGMLCGVSTDDITYMLRSTVTGIDVYEDVCLVEEHQHYIDYSTPLNWEKYTTVLRIIGVNQISLLELIHDLDRSQICWFLDNGVTHPTYNEFRRKFGPSSTYYFDRFKSVARRREAARNASIALIGVGKQRKHEPGALDAIRVIARAVWGLRLIGGESP